MYPAPPPQRLLSVFFLLNFSVWGIPGLCSPFPTHLHSDLSLHISPGPNPTPTLTSQCTTCKLYQPPSRPFTHSTCPAPLTKDSCIPHQGQVLDWEAGGCQWLREVGGQKRQEAPVRVNSPVTYHGSLSIPLNLGFISSAPNN